jgi:hypothetical protein
LYSQDLTKNNKNDFPDFNLLVIWPAVVCVRHYFAVTHHAQALKVENAFLPSIRKCVCDSQHKPQTQLTSTAQMDFKWIKAIIWYSAMHPEMMTKDIDHVATSHCPAYQMETDASTSVGGGGLIYEINDDGSRGRMVRQNSMG